jgi:hypothetical protein
MTSDTRAIALQRLAPFIGTWRLEAEFSPAVQSGVVSPDHESASAIFEWALGGQYLMQHSHAPHPAPDSLSIISFDADHETDVQHYFDSRGVVRVYAMTFSDGVWNLLRESPDFSPLDFSQRFTGTFSDDGDSIIGRWEISRNGSPWESDFDLSYFRVR